MLVYGDRASVLRPRSVVASLRRAALGDGAGAAGVAGTSARAFDRWTYLFLEVSALAQALLDGPLAHDAARDAAEVLHRIVRELARVAVPGPGFRSPPSRLPLRPLIDRLAALPLPDEASARVPEGYAYYGLFPECYAMAAQAGGLPPSSPVHVIGARTIGVSLGAVVAAALGPRASFLTVRPQGSPFARTVSAIELPRLHDGAYAIVDEGPGLSGSTFGSIADALLERGVSEDQIHYFPSHTGPLGPRASARHRARWESARRHVVDFDEAFVAEAPSPETAGPSTLPSTLASWVAPVTGPAVAPLEILGHGEWRRRVFRCEGDWPPVCPHLERRKYLVHTRDATYQLKFAGLGPYGAHKLAIAQRLARADFTVDALAMTRGFLVSPWIDARPLTLRALDEGRFDRRALLATVARYLAFRATELPCDDGDGATVEGLLAMAHHNAEAALGRGAAARVRELAWAVGPCARERRVVRVDAKLQPWEWLGLPDGSFRKADALDHHAGHDLIGAQDIGWDLAGAALELDLTDDERAELVDVVGRARGRAVSKDALRFYEVAYAAYWTGAYALAHDVVAPRSAAEATRIAAARDGYGRALEARLAERRPPRLWSQP